MEVIYVVFEDDCECPNSPEAAFLSKEKAEEYLKECKKHWGYYYIQEIEIMG